ncbi:hypothetical protein ACTXT7_017474 [Hymenolepis weldensis]
MRDSTMQHLAYDEGVMATLHTYLIPIYHRTFYLTMSRSYPIDTQSQRALQEIYEKESLAALKFFLLHQKPDEEDPPKLAAIKKTFQLEMPEKYSKLIEKRTKRKIMKRLDVNEEELLASTEEISLMRPVSSSSRNLLYGKHGETQCSLFETTTEAESRRKVRNTSHYSNGIWLEVISTLS